MKNRPEETGRKRGVQCMDSGRPEDKAMDADRRMELCRDATHLGRAVGETHRGVAGEPGCGPWLAISFRVAAGVVAEARFETYGCPTAVACGEIVCRVSEGRSLARLRSLTAEDVALLVGGVPEGKEQCPELAAEALARIRGRNGAAPEE
jgi:NifU-like protein involved in Fe-S cluster formation